MLYEVITLIAFSNEHPGAAARLFKDFAKANDKFSIKGGRVIDPANSMDETLDILADIV